MTRKEIIYRIILIVALLPVIFYSCWWGRKIYDLSRQQTELKKDFAELNNIQYGLFSVDVWRDNLTSIVISKIDSFDFTNVQRDTLMKDLNRILNALVTQADNIVNKKQTSLSGKIRKFAVRTFVNMDEVRKSIPQFSESILHEITKPSTRNRLRFLAKDKLSEFASQTGDSIGACYAIECILQKYKMKDVAVFNSTIKQRINLIQEETYMYAFALIGITVLFLLIWRWIRNQPALYTPMFTYSVLLALVILAIGLSSPTIEIDARIKELNFELLGKHIIFQDQVIFFQSKSIIDVVHILIATKKPDSMAVGFLILAFSILFPVAKLLSTKAYLLGNEKWKRNKFIYFFAFKSGKWSMADVMVVAIFMSYVGFKGILDNQLKIVNFKTDTLRSIATNETSLQPGFILFLTFVIFSLILSEILKRITARERAKIKAMMPEESGV
jgi:hypothetical protein